MRLTSLFLFSALAATASCARSLTPNETTFAKNLFGDTIDTEAVSVMAGIGLTPLPYEPKPDPVAEATLPPPRKAPDDLCVRKPSPRQGWSWPAAFVIDDNIYFSYKWYPFDAFEGMPDFALFPHSVLMAHELVHVWQWQNRARTHYSPMASGAESVNSLDPYYWVSEEGREFLSYGFEQQAAMVEDFVCYALFDPQDPKLDELADLLRPVLPVDDFLAAQGR